MKKHTLLFAAFLLGALWAPAHAVSPTGEALETARRIVERVLALDTRYPALKPLKAKYDPSQKLSTVYFENRVRWVAKDITQEGSPANPRRPVLDDGGMWWELYFYQGAEKNEKRTKPVQIGQLKVRFTHAYDGDPSLIRAIEFILKDEKKNFGKPRPPGAPATRP